MRGQKGDRARDEASRETRKGLGAGCRAPPRSAAVAASSPKKTQGPRRLRWTFSTPVGASKVVMLPSKSTRLSDRESESESRNSPRESGDRRRRLQLGAFVIRHLETSALTDDRFCGNKASSSQCTTPRGQRRCSTKRPRATGDELLTEIRSYAVAFLRVRNSRQLVQVAIPARDRTRQYVADPYANEHRSRDDLRAPTRTRFRLRQLPPLRLATRPDPRPNASDTDDVRLYSSLLHLRMRPSVVAGRPRGFHLPSVRSCDNFGVPGTRR